jgi:ribosomal protein S18 acetylase RimI-like enzyme
MIVRALAATDHDEVHEILRACGVFTDEEVRHALEMAGAPDDYAGFAAEVAGAVRGFVCIGPTPLTATTWHLYWIGVHPGAQRAGVGRALQAHAERVVRERGGERLVLETSGRPDYARARHFYEEAGYVKVGRIEDYYKPGDPCVIFCKTLPPHRRS